MKPIASATGPADLASAREARSRAHRRATESDSRRAHDLADQIENFTREAVGRSLRSISG